MCTAISLKTKDSYFGRNLDLEYSYNETVTICPENFPLYFRHEKVKLSHPAIIGMAYVKDGYPLYYEGANDCGLSMAGLNFPHYALYGQKAEGKHNVAPFEFIPFVLSYCKNISEAKELIENTNIIDESFLPELKNTPLHWMVSDGVLSLTVEQTKDGMRVYENKIGVLTNSPPFDYHMARICDFSNLCAKDEEKNGTLFPVSPYSRGMGAMGLPGDWSSSSRFVRASFTKLNSVSKDGEEESVSQFFHILSSVEHPRGALCLKDGSYQITRYSSCINLSKGIYYYTTYANRRITAVDMHIKDEEKNKLICFPLRENQDIYYEN